MFIHATSELYIFVLLLEHVFLTEICYQGLLEYAFLVEVRVVTHEHGEGEGGVLLPCK